MLSLLSDYALNIICFKLKGLNRSILITKFQQYYIDINKAAKFGYIIYYINYKMSSVINTVFIYRDMIQRLRRQSVKSSNKTKAAFRSRSFIVPSPTPEHHIEIDR